MVSGIWYSSVTDSRLEALTQYVKSIILDDKVMLLSLNGDASFRRYFRVLNKNLIAVDAPPKTQKIENLWLSIQLYLKRVLLFLS